MAKLTEIQTENQWTDAEMVNFAVTTLNMDEAYAIFALAMEKGEVAGDVIEDSAQDTRNAD